MKTKLGISAGLLAFICFLVGQFFGGISFIVLAGYILLVEEDEFLRASALKALFIILFVDVLDLLVGLLPDLFTLIDWFTRIFNAETRFNNVAAIAKIDQIIDFVMWIVLWCKKVLMLVLAFLALSKKTISVPFVEGFIKKHAKVEKNTEE
ncbi:MAG: hypothetical protein IKN24_00530 [Lachnospiraceae bacterium]|nr:hypothetical protein [Lachnospiraceae bacterium]